MADIVRATYYVTDAGDADAVLAVCGENFGDIRPAATLLVVAGLYKPEMKIEIEVTAKRRTPNPLIRASRASISGDPSMSPSAQIHAKISGPIVMIGFGSIGKGTLPLIERHFDYDKSRFVIIDPHEDGEIAKKHGVRFIKQAITRDNYREVLVPLLTAGGGQGFCVNLSVDTSSVDIMTMCREIGSLYIDTVVEPWLGFYFDKNAGPEKRSNYALRETLLAAKHAARAAPTAVSTCGANPGMVSWFVKQALLDIARDTNTPFNEPKSREGWGQLAHKLGVKGIHIAERDTQRSKKPKPMNVFVNTWSVEGFVSEGMQPAELGWGTHEKWMPDNGRTPRTTAAARRSICCSPAPIPACAHGARRRARNTAFSSPTMSSISIADYFTVRDGQQRHLSPDLPLRLSPGQRRGAVAARDVRRHRQDAAVMAHPGRERDRGRHRRTRRAALRPRKNAYWYGSQLSIEETREVAPYQNATGMQVSSAVLAGMVWALENPNEGIVEADEMDFRRCLEIQRPYLGPVKGYYTDWTPLSDRPGLFPEDIDTQDPWQFRNVLVR